MRKRATLLAMLVLAAVTMGQQDPCAVQSPGGEDTFKDNPAGGGTEDNALEDPGGGGTEGSTFEDPSGGGTETERTPQRTRRFSGNGSKNIGTVKITDDAVLKWRNAGGEYATGMFMAYDKEFKLNVSSDAKSGNSALEPGTYRSISVSGDDWSMTIKGR